ncbi:hypothetical protein U1Q18_014458 [Sarracenia purpurea var. burkii]
MLQVWKFCCIRILCWSIRCHFGQSGGGEVLQVRKVWNHPLGSFFGCCASLVEVLAAIKAGIKSLFTAGAVEAGPAVAGFSDCLTVLGNGLAASKFPLWPKSRIILFLRGVCCSLRSLALATVALRVLALVVLCLGFGRLVSDLET